MPSDLLYCDLVGAADDLAKELEVAVKTKNVKAKVLYADKKQLKHSNTEGFYPEGLVEDREKTAFWEKEHEKIKAYNDKHNIEKAEGVPAQAGLPPGPPPRPGLQWKEESSRWIRPDKEMTSKRSPVIQTTQAKYKDKFDLFLQQEKFRKVLPDLANSAPRNTEALIKYLTEHIPENASKFAKMLDWLNGYSKLAMDHQNVSDEEVDRLFKRCLKVGGYAIDPEHKRPHIQFVQIDANLSVQPFIEAEKDPTRLN